MNTLALDFAILYVLESPEITLVEIQRKDLEEYASLSPFQWLWIDHTTLAIQQLTFRSMDASSDVEERFFEEGFLKFNKESGTYIAKFNSAQHPLLRKLPTQLSPAFAVGRDELPEQQIKNVNDQHKSWPGQTLQGTSKRYYE